MPLKVSGDTGPSSSIPWICKLIIDPNGGLYEKRSCGFSFGNLGDKEVTISSSSFVFLTKICLSITLNFYLIAGRHTSLGYSLQTEKLWEFLWFSNILRKTSPPHKHTNIQTMLRIWLGRQDGHSARLFPINRARRRWIPQPARDAGCLGETKWFQMESSVPVHYPFSSYFK